jgi:hypothetical protein
VQAYLADSQSHVVALYRLEKSGAFDSGSQQGKVFAVDRLAEATAMLRDLVVDAWRASGKTILNGQSIADLEAGRVDPRQAD